MKQQINVVYNSIIAGLFIYSKPKIRAETINNEQYLVSEKVLRKAQIELRAKIPIEYLELDDVVYDYNDLSNEKQEYIKGKLTNKLTFTSQEILMLFYILHLQLNNCWRIDIENIHIGIRGQRKIELGNAQDLTTFNAYQKAVSGLCNKTLRIEIEKCNPKLYGVSNKAFTQTLLNINDSNFDMGNLLKLVELSGLYSEEYMPKEIFKCRLNQITRFLISYIISYEIYNYKRYKPELEYYELKMQTLMKKIPYFLKDGTNSNMNYYQYIQSSQSKTIIISRFFVNCQQILDLYENENIISSYTITPYLTKIGVKDFERIKFCIKLRG